jgi:site-specific DNA recombinase
MKAIIIARVSTEEQREAGNSLPAQVTRLENYCKHKEFTIIRACSFDESAYTDDRSEFDNIINFILEQKEKVAICCDKVDRLSRNVFDKRIALLYERALKDELELHFISDGQVITSRISAVEKFNFSMSLGLAKYYSDAISDNVKRAMEQKVRKGEWLAKAPYGYKNVRYANDVADVILQEREGQLVQKLFELYATAAYSMDLLSQKFQTEHGIFWPKGTIGKMLSNPFYHGDMIVKGKTYPHRYPPIVSKELFMTVQDVKYGFHKKPIKYAGQPYIYRGLIRCGDCGMTITPEKHKGFVYYHCTQYRGKHGAKWFREETLTKTIGQAFKDLQMPPEIVQELVQTLNSLNQEKETFYKTELSNATSEHKKITKMLDNLYVDKLQGSITESVYTKFFTQFNEQLTMIEARLTGLQEADQDYYITAKYVLDLANRAYDLFVSSEVEEKRQLIKLILSNLRVEGEKVLWELHSPFDLISKSSDRQSWRS